MTAADHPYNVLTTADEGMVMDETEDRVLDGGDTTAAAVINESNSNHHYPPPTNAPVSSGPDSGGRLSTLRRLMPAFGTVRNTIREGITPRGPTFIQRTVGSILPTHYTRVPTEEGSSRNIRPVGGGLENDGVFANVMAKPTVARTIVDENGDVHVMPEEAQSDVPPSYVVAQADSVPPYQEANVLQLPRLVGIDADPIIEGLPCGSFFSFAWNFLISMSFQFVGFLLTYLLHTTHAAKFGSRAGLGVTLIQFGLYSHASPSDTDVSLIGDASENSSSSDKVEQITRLIRRGSDVLYGRTWMPASSMSQGMADNSTATDSSSSQWGTVFGSPARDWFSFLLMTIGWFLLLSSLLGFARVKRWEKSLHRATNPSPPPSSDELQRDLQIRHNLERVFGLGLDEYDEDDEEQDLVEPDGTPISAEEAGLRRDLIAAGLI